MTSLTNKSDTWVNIEETKKNRNKLTDKHHKGTRCPVSNRGVGKKNFKRFWAKQGTYKWDTVGRFAAIFYLTYLRWAVRWDLQHLGQWQYPGHFLLQHWSQIPLQGPSQSQPIWIERKISLSYIDQANMVKESDGCWISFFLSFFGRKEAYAARQWRLCLG